MKKDQQDQPEGKSFIMQNTPHVTLSLIMLYKLDALRLVYVHCTEHVTDLHKLQSFTHHWGFWFNFGLF